MIAAVVMAVVADIQAMEQGPSVWEQEAAQIRQRTDAFRTGVTVEAAAKGEMLKALNADVDARVVALRDTLGAAYAKVPGGVSVLKYLPENPVLDGSVDYRLAIQKALLENDCVTLTGSGDPAKPNVYGVSCDSDARCGLVVPAGKTLAGEPGAVLLRLPSRGSLVVLEKGARVMGVAIDGNKRGHAVPAWVDAVGKQNGASFEVRGDGAALSGCASVDAPGHGFATYARGALLWRCTARNSGMIDLKFNANFYQGKWDNWSGDGFYIRGFHSVVMDCESYDCFRWGYTTCHEKAGAATYIDCSMYNEAWATYGFIDIEDCSDDREGTVLIGMKAPKGKKTAASVSSEKTVFLGCELGCLRGYSANHLLVAGCTIRGGGLGVGGWSSPKNAWVRGGASPVILANTIIKTDPGSGIQEVSDWSLSVFSTDGKGVVVGNTLKEYEGPMGKGPGMKLDQVPEANNKVEYGQWITQTAAAPASPEAKSAADELRQRKLRDFGAGMPDLARKLGIRGTVTRTVMLRPQALFLKDPDNAGEKQAWFDPAKRPPAGTLTPIALGDSWQNQIGDYSGIGWYFTSFQVTGDDFHVCDAAHLVFGSVSAECQVYVNGRLVGEFKQWNAPFKLNIPVVFKGIVRWDDTATNDVAIRVFSPGTIGGVYEHAALVLSKGGGEAPAEPVTAK
jgi:hypothetical protein